MGKDRGSTSAARKATFEILSKARIDLTEWTKGMAEMAKATQETTAQMTTMFSGVSAQMKASSDAFTGFLAKMKTDLAASQEVLRQGLMGGTEESGSVLFTSMTSAVKQLSQSLLALQDVSKGVMATVNKVLIGDPTSGGQTGIEAKADQLEKGMASLTTKVGRVRARLATELKSINDPIHTGGAQKLRAMAIASGLFPSESAIDAAIEDAWEKHKSTMSKAVVESTTKLDAEYVMNQRRMVGRTLLQNRLSEFARSKAADEEAFELARQSVRSNKANEAVIRGLFKDINSARRGTREVISGMTGDDTIDQAFIQAQKIRNESVATRTQLLVDSQQEMTNMLASSAAKVTELEAKNKAAKTAFDAAIEARAAALLKSEFNALPQVLTTAFKKEMGQFNDLRELLRAGQTSIVDSRRDLDELEKSRDKFAKDWATGLKKAFGGGPGQKQLKGMMDELRSAMSAPSSLPQETDFQLKANVVGSPAWAEAMLRKFSIPSAAGTPVPGAEVGERLTRDRARVDPVKKLVKLMDSYGKYLFPDAETSRELVQLQKLAGKGRTGAALRRIEALSVEKAFEELAPQERSLANSYRAAVKAMDDFMGGPGQSRPMHQTASTDPEYLRLRARLDSMQGGPEYTAYMKAMDAGSLIGAKLTPEGGIDPADAQRILRSIRSLMTADEKAAADAVSKLYDITSAREELRHLFQGKEKEAFAELRKSLAPQKAPSGDVWPKESLEKRSSLFKEREAIVEKEVKSNSAAYQAHLARMKKILSDAAVPAKEVGLVKDILQHRQFGGFLSDEARALRESMGKAKLGPIVSEARASWRKFEMEIGAGNAEFFRLEKEIKDLTAATRANFQKALKPQAAEPKLVLTPEQQMQMTLRMKLALGQYDSIIAALKVPTENALTGAQFAARVKAEGERFAAQQGVTVDQARTAVAGFGTTAGFTKFRETMVDAFEKNEVLRKNVEETISQRIKSSGASTPEAVAKIRAAVEEASRNSSTREVARILGASMGPYSALIEKVEQEILAGKVKLEGQIAKLPSGEMDRVSSTYMRHIADAFPQVFPTAKAATAYLNKTIFSQQSAASAISGLFAGVVDARKELIADLERQMKTGMDNLAAKQSGVLGKFAALGRGLTRTALLEADRSARFEAADAQYTQALSRLEMFAAKKFGTQVQDLEKLIRDKQAHAEVLAAKIADYMRPAEGKKTPPKSTTTVKGKLELDALVKDAQRTKDELADYREKVGTLREQRFLAIDQKLTGNPELQRAYGELQADVEDTLTNRNILYKKWKVTAEKLHATRVEFEKLASNLDPSGVDSSKAIHVMMKKLRGDLEIEMRAAAEEGRAPIAPRVSDIINNTLGLTDKDRIDVAPDVQKRLQNALDTAVRQITAEGGPFSAIRKARIELAAEIGRRDDVSARLRQPQFADAAIEAAKASIRLITQETDLMVRTAAEKSRALSAPREMLTDSTSAYAEAIAASERKLREVTGKSEAGDILAKYISDYSKKILDSQNVLRRARGEDPADTLAQVLGTEGLAKMEARIRRSAEERLAADISKAEYGGERKSVSAITDEFLTGFKKRFDARETSHADELEAIKKHGEEVRSITLAQEKRNAAALVGIKEETLLSQYTAEAAMQPGGSWKASYATVNRAKRDAAEEAARDAASITERENAATAKTQLALSNLVMNRQLDEYGEYWAKRRTIDTVNLQKETADFVVKTRDMGDLLRKQFAEQKAVPGMDMSLLTKNFGEQMAELSRMSSETMRTLGGRMGKELNAIMEESRRGESRMFAPEVKALNDFIGTSKVQLREAYLTQMRGLQSAASLSGMTPEIEQSMKAIRDHAANSFNFLQGLSGKTRAAIEGDFVSQAETARKAMRTVLGNDVEYHTERVRLEKERMDLAVKNDVARIMSSKKVSEAQARAESSIAPMQAAYNRNLDAQLAAIKQYHGPIQAMSRSLMSFSYQLSHTAMQLQMQGAALMGIVYSVVHYSTMYEKQMALLKGALAETNATTAGATREMENMKRLADESAALSQTSIYDVTSIAETQKVLAHAGLQVNEVISATPRIMDMAAAGEMKLADAANTAVTTMRQFGLEAEQMGRITNVITTTAIATSAEVKGMAEALKYVGPIAANLGMSLEETTVALGLLSNAGIKNSMAGTTLRRMLTALVNPTRREEEVLRSLNVQISDAEGNFVGVIEVLRQLQGALRGSTKVEVSKEFMQLFQQRAGAGAAALFEMLRNNKDAITDLMDKTEEYGKDQLVAKTRTESLEGSLAKLKNSFTALNVAIGERTTGGLKELIQYGTSALQILADLVRGGNELTETFLATGLKTAAAMGLLSTAIATTSFAVSGIASGLSLLTSATISVGAGFGAIKSLITGLRWVGVAAAGGAEGFKLLSLHMANGNTAAKLVGTQMASMHTYITTAMASGTGFVGLLGKMGVTAEALVLTLQGVSAAIGVIGVAVAAVAGYTAYKAWEEYTTVVEDAEMALAGLKEEIAKPPKFFDMSSVIRGMSKEIDAVEGSAKLSGEQRVERVKELALEEVKIMSFRNQKLFILQRELETKLGFNTASFGLFGNRAEIQEELDRVKKLLQDNFASIEAHVKTIRMYGYTELRRDKVNIDDLIRYLDETVGNKKEGIAGIAGLLADDLSDVSQAVKTWGQEMVAAQQRSLNEFYLSRDAVEAYRSSYASMAQLLNSTEVWKVNAFQKEVQRNGMLFMMGDRMVSKNTDLQKSLFDLMGSAEYRAQSDEVSKLTWELSKYESTLSTMVTKVDEAKPKTWSYWEGLRRRQQAVVDAQRKLSNMKWGALPASLTDSEAERRRLGAYIGETTKQAANRMREYYQTLSEIQSKYSAELRMGFVNFDVNQNAEVQILQSGTQKKLGLIKTYYTEVLGNLDKVKAYADKLLLNKETIPDELKPERIAQAYGIALDEVRKNVKTLRQEALSDQQAMHTEFNKLQSEFIEQQRKNRDVLEDLNTPSDMPEFEKIPLLRGEIRELQEEYRKLSEAGDFSGAAKSALALQAKQAELIKIVHKFGEDSWKNLSKDQQDTIAGQDEYFKRKKKYQDENAERAKKDPTGYDKLRELLTGTKDVEEDIASTSRMYANAMKAAMDAVAERQRINIGYLSQLDAISASIEARWERISKTSGLDKAGLNEEGVDISGGTKGTTIAKRYREDKMRETSDTRRNRSQIDFNSSLGVSNSQTAKAAGLVNNVANGVGRLTNRMDDARAAGVSTNQIMQQMGVSASQLRTKLPVKIFFDQEKGLVIINDLDKIKNGADKATDSLAKLAAVKLAPGTDKIHPNFAGVFTNIPTEAEKAAAAIADVAQEEENFDFQLRDSHGKLEAKFDRVSSVMKAMADVAKEGKEAFVLPDPKKGSYAQWRALKDMFEAAAKAHEDEKKALGERFKANMMTEDQFVKALETAESEAHNILGKIKAEIDRLGGLELKPVATAAFLEALDKVKVALGELEPKDVQTTADARVQELQNQVEDKLAREQAAKEKKEKKAATMAGHAAEATKADALAEEQRFAKRAIKSAKKLLSLPGEFIDFLTPDAEQQKRRSRRALAAYYSSFFTTGMGAYASPGTAPYKEKLGPALETKLLSVMQEADSVFSKLDQVDQSRFVEAATLALLGELESSGVPSQFAEKFMSMTKLSIDTGYDDLSGDPLSMFITADITQATTQLKDVLAGAALERAGQIEKIKTDSEAYNAAIKSTGDQLVETASKVQQSYKTYIPSSSYTEGGTSTGPAVETEKKAFGGHISGYGGGDTVPALLEPGEFVLRKESVKKYGTHNIAALNEGRVSKFATGGEVTKKKKKSIGKTDETEDTDSSEEDSTEKTSGKIEDKNKVKSKAPGHYWKYSGYRNYYNPNKMFSEGGLVQMFADGGSVQKPPSSLTSKLKNLWGEVQTMAAYGASWTDENLRKENLEELASRGGVGGSDGIIARTIAGGLSTGVGAIANPLAKVEKYIVDAFGGDTKYAAISNVAKLANMGSEAFAAKEGEGFGQGLMAMLPALAVGAPAGKAVGQAFAQVAKARAGTAAGKLTSAIAPYAQQYATWFAGNPGDPEAALFGAILHGAKIPTVGLAKKLGASDFKQKLVGGATAIGVGSIKGGWNGGLEGAAEEAVSFSIMEALGLHGPRAAKPTGKNKGKGKGKGQGQDLSSNVNETVGDASSVSAFVTRGQKTVDAYNQMKRLKAKYKALSEDARTGKEGQVLRERVATMERVLEELAIDTSGEILWHGGSRGRGAFEATEQAMKRWGVAEVGDQGGFWSPQGQGTYFADRVKAAMHYAKLIEGKKGTLDPKGRPYRDASLYEVEAAPGTTVLPDLMSPISALTPQQLNVAKLRTQFSHSPMVLSVLDMPGATYMDLVRRVAVANGHGSIELMATGGAGFGKRSLRSGPDTVVDDATTAKRRAAENAAMIDIGARGNTAADSTSRQKSLVLDDVGNFQTEQVGTKNYAFRDAGPDSGLKIVNAYIRGKNGDWVPDPLFPAAQRAAQAKFEKMKSISKPKDVAAAVPPATQEYLEITEPEWTRFRAAYDLAHPDPNRRFRLNQVVDPKTGLLTFEGPDLAGLKQLGSGVEINAFGAEQRGDSPKILKISKPRPNETEADFQYRRARKIYDDQAVNPGDLASMEDAGHWIDQFGRKQATWVQNDAGTVAPTVEEVVRTMTDRGYTQAEGDPQTYYRYVNDGKQVQMITDLHLDNVRKLPDGRLVIIDSNHEIASTDYFDKAAPEATVAKMREVAATKGMVKVAQPPEPPKVSTEKAADASFSDLYEEFGKDSSYINEQPTSKKSNVNEAPVPGTEAAKYQDTITQAELDSLAESVGLTSSRTPDALPKPPGAEAAGDASKVDSKKTPTPLPPSVVREATKFLDGSFRDSLDEVVDRPGADRTSEAYKNSVEETLQAVEEGKALSEKLLESPKGEEIYSDFYDAMTTISEKDLDSAVQKMKDALREGNTATGFAKGGLVKGRFANGASASVKTDSSKLKATSSSKHKKKFKNPITLLPSNGGLGFAKGGQVKGRFASGASAPSQPQSSKFKASSSSSHKRRFKNPVNLLPTGGGLGFSTGGHLPGYGGGDRIDIIAESGEFVIRKEAVKRYGIDFISALNQMAVPPSVMPLDRMANAAVSVAPKVAMATGGPVIASDSTSGTGDTVNLNLMIGERVVEVRTTEINKKKLVDAINEVNRREGRTVR